MRWRIYYGDGLTYFGAPENAPGRNVQVVAYESDLSPTGFRLMHGYDYFVWRDEWIGVNRVDLDEYLDAPGWTRIIKGRTIKDEDFHAIVGRAGREGIA